MLFDDTLLDDGQDDALIQAADRGERQAQHQIQLGGNPLAAQRGRFRFVPEPLHERRSQKFFVHERVVRLRPVQEGRLIPQQQLADALTRGLRRAVEQVLDQQKVPDTDRFYISLASDRLRGASNAFHLTAQEWRQNGLRTQTLLDNLSKMLNSNEQFEMDDSFNLSVVHVRPPPRGKGEKTPTRAWPSIERSSQTNEKVRDRDASGRRGLVCRESHRHGARAVSSRTQCPRW